MWPPWGKRIPRGKRPAAAATDAALAAPPPAPSQSSFSFKDLHVLLSDVEDATATPTPGPSPGRPASPKPLVFRRACSASSALLSFRSLPPDPASNRIVLYYSSLRAVRKTFEDCRIARSILRGLRVAVDERDVSMDSSFLAELKVLLGRRQLSLPRVFIGGWCVGGADEIRQLHESGELKRIVEGFPAAAAGGSCGACGGAGFVLCRHCSGSHKRHSDKSGFRSCTACNENGLIRCPDCSLPAL